MFDQLHEFVHKRSNMHKVIKILLFTIQGTLGSAVKEWMSMAHRAKTAEKELSATKKASVASRTPEARKVETSTTAKEVSVVRKYPPKDTNYALLHAEVVKAAGSKKHKDAHFTDAYPSAENIAAAVSHTSCQVGGRRTKESGSDDRSEKLKFTRRSAKGEAPIVIGTMRTNPNA